MNKLQKQIAKLLIPRGYYCEIWNRKEKKIDGHCPFWFLDRARPGQENGYCSFIGKGDWDINAEHAEDDVEVTRRDIDGTETVTIEKYKDLPPTSMLWDCLKQCGVKD